MISLNALKSRVANTRVTPLWFSQRFWECASKKSWFHISNTQKVLRNLKVLNIKRVCRNVSFFSASKQAWLLPRLFVLSSEAPRIIHSCYSTTYNFVHGFIDQHFIFEWKIALHNVYAFTEILWKRVLQKIVLRNYFFQNTIVSSCDFFKNLTKHFR